MTLVDVRQFRVPRKVVDETESSLRSAGRDEHELFVLWSGTLGSSGSFNVLTAHVPRQTAYRHEEGVGVRVDGEALHELNAWLFQAGERLCAQVHSHPQAAFHSETDDTYPIVTAMGGLSIVVPYFCQGLLLSRGTVAYRLTKKGWLEPREPLNQLVQVL